MLLVAVNAAYRAHNLLLACTLCHILLPFTAVQQPLSCRANLAATLLFFLFFCVYAAYGCKVGFLSGSVLVRALPLPSLFYLSHYPTLPHLPTCLPPVPLASSLAVCLRALHATHCLSCCTPRVTRSAV